MSIPETESCDFMFNKILGSLCVYVFLHVCMHLCVLTCVHLCACMFACIVCAHMCVHVYVHMYVCVHVCMCLCMWRPEVGVSHLSFYLAPLDRVSHWTWSSLIQLAWQVMNTSDLQSLWLWACASVPGFLCECWEYERWSSCLYDKHLTNWAILSQAPLKHPRSVMELLIRSISLASWTW